MEGQELVLTILVPGIKGTKLINVNTLNFDIIYSGIEWHFESMHDLALGPEPTIEQNRQVIIERADVEDLAYREMVSILRREVKQPLFIFGYDWRQSCHELGKRLIRYVESLRERHGQQTKFNLPTHSMGELVFAGFPKV